MTKLDSILKSRETKSRSLQTKICLVKPMVFPVVMYGCESWILKESFFISSGFWWSKAYFICGSVTLILIVTDFIFLGAKSTADGDCGHEIKRRLLLGRKVMTNLDSILKSRDVTLPTKVRLVKAMVFPVVMCGCESWTVKKAECRRTDAFELWCWRRLLRVPWTARRSNQSILKEISPGCSLEGLMLKLKL